jgi:hypothetical protein
MAFWSPTPDSARRVTAPKARDLARALVALEVARASLTAVGTTRTWASLERALRAPRMREAQPSTHPSRWVVAVARVGRRGPRRWTCLERSTALWWLLQRAGFAAEIKIGVAPLDDSLEAHAWVELDGDVLGDDPGAVEEYAAFAGGMTRAAAER